MSPTSTTTPPWYGTAAPITPEPPPRGTTGTPCSVAARSTEATSASVRARTTTSGNAASPCAIAYSELQDQSRAQRSSSTASVDVPATVSRRMSMKEGETVERDTRAFPVRSSGLGR